MPDAMLRAERFSYCYPDAPATPVLSDLSLALEPGSFTVLAGASGSGKSTLLRAACGLVPHFHGGEAAGELAIGGLSVREHGPSELAAICGTVFQDPESQVVMSGVRAEIALALEHRGEPAVAIARAVEEVALALGIAQLLDRRTETLSGGELQRVALAAALVHRPALVLLDEPTSQLDPVAADELVWLLRRLNEEWGTTVILAEHRLERCLGAADRVIALEQGRLACDAAPADFLAWAMHGHERSASPPLATPAARLFALAGLWPLPASVKEGRALLRAATPTAGAASGAVPGSKNGSRIKSPNGSRNGSRESPRSGRFARSAPLALRLRGVWHELRDGPVILRGVDLEIAPGERVALMGRNGAGKSTLLRHAKGLMAPTRGSVDRAGEVALLLQNPGDYLVHDRAIDEAGPDGLAAAGLRGRAQADPRDLSGGERQRLALEVVLDSRSALSSAAAPPALICLDEPTRGMDRAWKDALARRLEVLAATGAAVLVATHDTEFAAELAERVVLMGNGSIVADGPAREVLAGGWHFTTDVARILDGAGGALTPAEGARLLCPERVP